MNSPAAAVRDDAAAFHDGLAVDTDVRAEGWAAAVRDPESVCARAALAAYARAGDGDSPAEVSIVLGDDAFLKGLNARYRGKDKATNVLSFPGDRESANGMPAMLGDIAVALETVVGEAEAGSRPVSDHLAHMIVHGMLHLLGHDHEVDEEAACMEALETEILGSLGVADPYRADGE